MDVVAALHVRDQPADGLAVFDDVLAGVEVLQRDLVADLQNQIKAIEENLRELQEE